MAVEELSTDSIKGDVLAPTQAAPHGPQSTTALPPPRRAVGFGLKATTPHLPSRGTAATAWFLTRCLLGTLPLPLPLIL